MKVQRWQLARMREALQSGGFEASDIEDIISKLGWEVEIDPPMPDPLLPTEPGDLIEVHEVDGDSVGPRVAVLDETGEWHTAYESLAPTEITGFRTMVAKPREDVCTEPAGLWRAIGPYDSSPWAESSNREEVLHRLRPSDRFEQLYTSTPTTTWKEEPR